MIIKLIRCCHGRAAYAVYAFNLHKLYVYLRHNKPARKDWGDMYLSCYLHPNTPKTDNDVIESSFTSYAEFREYRKMLYAAHGPDKKIKIIG